MKNILLAAVAALTLIIPNAATAQTPSPQPNPAAELFWTACTTPAEADACLTYIVANEHARPVNPDPRTTYCIGPAVTLDALVATVRSVLLAHPDLQGIDPIVAIPVILHFSFPCTQT